MTSRRSPIPSSFDKSRGRGTHLRSQYADPDENDDRTAAAPAGATQSNGSSMRTLCPKAAPAAAFVFARHASIARHIGCIALAIATLAAPTALAVAPAIWTSACSGSHGGSPPLAIPSGARVNFGRVGIGNRRVTIANPGHSVIALTAQNKTDIANYLENDVFDVTPLPASTTYNQAVVISIVSDVIMNTALTGLNVLETVAALPPVRWPTAFPTGQSRSRQRARRSGSSRSRTVRATPRPRP